LKMVKNELVRDSRGARHEEFSFDKLVMIIVVRTGIEVGDGD